MKTLAETIKSYEERLLKPDVRKSLEEVSKLLADDFYEIGKSGKTFTKSQVIESMQKESDDYSVSLSNFELRELDTDLLQATYKTTNHRTGISAIRSTLWRKNESGWQAIFHQGTPTPD